MENKRSMSSTLNDLNLKRKSFDEYKQMGKKELLVGMSLFLINFDKLRYKFVEMQLQNNYLERRNKMIEEQLEFYKMKVNVRSFKHGIPKNRVVKKNL